jgi:Uma2 family endonuclease
MSTRTLITPEEYERMSFEGPEPDYLDGELVERPLPNDSHSSAQTELIAVFLEFRKSHPVHIRPELRLHVSSHRYRIADLAVFLGERPAYPYPTTPPLIVIEIISPDEKHSELMSKLEDYEAWGVIQVWAVNPELKRLYVFSRGTLAVVSRWQVPEIGVEITPEQVF